jgi:hypothetical protein
LTEGMVALDVPLSLVVGDKRHGEQASPVQPPAGAALKAWRPAQTASHIRLGLKEAPTG